MSESIRKVSTIFTIDDNEHNKKFKEINSQYKLTQSEIKLAGERLNYFGKNTSDLTYKQQALVKQTETLKDKINLYKDSIEKASNKAKENNDKLVQHDQTVINVLFQDNIGALPIKYGIFNFTDMEMVNDYSNRLVAKNKYTKNEILQAYEKPAILHYVYKPWEQNEVNRKDLWWEYAAKTDYFDEIKTYYGLA